MADTTIPACPPGTGPAGRRLWRGVLGDYRLAAHEVELLRQAVIVADVLSRLEAEARTVPLTITDARGEMKSHPVLVELRQQQQRYASLISSMRLPDLETGDRPQHRGAARGPHLRGRATGRRYGETGLRIAEAT